MRQLKITTQITNRDSDAVDIYLWEIGKIPMISADQEIMLAKEKDKYGIKSPKGQSAVEKLVKANLRFVVSVAKQYQYQGLALSDLMNEGNLGLIKAAERFDHTRGFKFISYAVRWIRQSILQALAEQARLVRLPQNKIAVNNKINKKFIALEQEREREPSVEEVAEALDMNEEEVLAGLQGYGFHSSLDANLREDDDRTPYDVMENPDARQTEEWIESDSLKQVFLGMFSSLKPRDRDIMNYYFTLDPDTYMDIEALGVKYDLTRERIRQIKESIIKKRQTRKIKNIKKEITGEASKVRIVANLADTATPPHLREPVQKKEIITQHITSPIVSTHYISEVKQKLQETLQSYTEIRKEDIETMEEAPQMPVGLLKKEHRRAIQGFANIARWISQHAPDTARCLCTADTLRQLIGAYETHSVRTLLNILEHMKDISSVALGTPHVLFDQVIESYTSHKSNRREYVFEFIFTDSFIRYVSALPTIEKVDSIDLPGKYANTLLDELLPYKHKKYKEYNPLALSDLLGIKSIGAQRCMQHGNYYPIRDAIEDINRHSSIYVRCHEHHGKIRFEISPKLPPTQDAFLQKLHKPYHARLESPKEQAAVTENMGSALFTHANELYETNKDTLLSTFTPARTSVYTKNESEHIPQIPGYRIDASQTGEILSMPQPALAITIGETGDVYGPVGNKALYTAVALTQYAQKTYPHIRDIACSIGTFTRLTDTAPESAKRALATLTEVQGSTVGAVTFPLLDYAVIEEYRKGKGAIGTIVKFRLSSELVEKISPASHNRSPLSLPTIHSLTSKHALRLYEIFSSLDEGTYTLSRDEFREMMGYKHDGKPTSIKKSRIDKYIEDVHTHTSLRLSFDPHPFHVIFTVQHT